MTNAFSKTVQSSRSAWMTRMIALAVLAVGSLAPGPARADFAQQSARLVGTGGMSPEGQGAAIAISADGNTMLVGAPLDGNPYLGAAWIFVRKGAIWSEAARLVAGDPTADARFGRSVALSADGNTAVIGAPSADNFIGAAYVFVRSNGAWTQQDKLVADPELTIASQGSSVAISADGNTIASGGPADGSDLGAAWVFVRSANVWTQQAKVTGVGGNGNYIRQGSAVALSSDGDTLAVGAPNDEANVGSVWMFARSAGSWSQQGSKLIPSGCSCDAQFGYAVALSNNGDTVLVGGPSDEGAAGAAWVFERAAGAWTPQGGKLTASDRSGIGTSGMSVSLSGDGSLAVIGAPMDHAGAGAAFAFVRNGATWSQLGSKLTVADAVGNPGFGSAVALSADGKTVAVGGYYDSNNIGASWAFTRRGFDVAARDFGGDLAGDLLWRHSDGSLVLWQMQAPTVASSRSLGRVGNWQIVGQRDFDGDGRIDILWREPSASAWISNVALWRMRGHLVSSSVTLGYAPPNWSVVSTGDLDSDGKGDVLWRDAESGDIAVWLMNQTGVREVAAIGNVPVDWAIVASGDLDGDGKSDLIWRHASGQYAIWLMNGARVRQASAIGQFSGWTVVGVGDFDGDGKGDIVWRDTNGAVAVWYMDGIVARQVAGFGVVPTAWSIVATGDFNGDSKSDVLWRDTAGEMAIWQMNGSAVAQVAPLGATSSWTVQSANAN